MIMSLRKMFDKYIKFPMLWGIGFFVLTKNLLNFIKNIQKTYCKLSDCVVK